MSSPSSSSSINDSKESVVDSTRNSLFVENGFDHFNNWHSDLFQAKLTPDAQLISLKNGLGTSLLKVIETHRAHLSLIQFMKDDEDAVQELTESLETKYKDIGCDLKSKFKPAFETLKNQLEKAIAKYGDKGAFVRLSTRSPKDGVLNLPKTKQLLLNELDSLPKFRARITNQNTLKDLQMNRAALAYFRATCAANRVVCANDALELLINSKRAFNDLLSANLEMSGKEASAGREFDDVYVVVRPWMTDLKTELEFRCFAVERKLVAITQYHKSLFIPNIVNNADKIIALIQKTFDKANKTLNRVDKNGRFCIDIVLSENLESAMVIEINEPAPMAGGSLFDWNNEKDRLLLEKGESEESLPIFRFQKKPLKFEESRKDIHPPLLALIDEYLHEKNTMQPFQFAILVSITAFIVYQIWR